MSMYETPFGGPTGMGQGGTLGVSVPTGNPLMTDPFLIEEKFNAVQQFNQVSDLPPLPDEATVDLLMSDELQDVASVNELLFGIQDDILSKPEAQMRLRDSRAEAFATETTFGDAPSTLFAPMDSDIQQLRKITNGIGGWAGDRPLAVPSDPSAAVIDITVRAIEAGLLPEDYPITGRWTPQLRDANRELVQMRTRDMMAGARPGAMSVEQSQNLMDRLLSPSSLISAAVAMDFLPDLGAINEEAKGWGGKIGDWLSSPENFINPRKFVRALGPIDDIVFPVINSAMLMMGVNGVIQFSRVLVASKALGGARALRTAQGLSAAQKGFLTGKIATPVMLSSARAAKYAGDINRLAQPGLIGQKLTNVLPTVSKGMESWRTFHTVQMAKRGVQSAAKAGFIAEMEGFLAPDRDPGLGLGGDIDQPFQSRLDSFKAWRTTNPIGAPLAMVFEPALTPVTYFPQGTFTKPLKGLASGVMKRLVDISQDEVNTAILFQAMQRTFSDKPEMLQTFNKLADSNLADAVTWGLQPAEVRMGISQTGQITELMREEAGEKMLWLGLYTAINKNVRQIIADMGLVEATMDPANFSRLQVNLRKWFDLRLQDLDLENFDPDNIADVQRYIAHRSGLFEEASSGDIEAIRRIRTDNIKKMMNMDGDNFVKTALAEIDQHVDLRVATANDLLAGLEPEDLVAGWQEMGESLAEDWEKWTTATLNLDAADVAVSPVTTRELMGDADFQPWADGVINEELMQYMPEPRDRSEILQEPFNRMQRGIREGTKNLTVARETTPTKVTAFLFEDSVKQLTEARDALGELPVLEMGRNKGAREAVGSLEEYAAKFNKGVRDLTNTEIEQWVASMAEDAADALSESQIKRVRRFGNAVRMLAQNGYPTADIQAHLASKLDQIADAPIWQHLKVRMEKFDEAKGVFRPTNLDERMDDLSRTKHMLGIEVHIDDADMAQHLRDQKYKIVAGDDFLQFHHVSDMAAPLAQIRRNFLARRSLGTFMTRQAHQRTNVLRESIFRQNLSGKVLELFDNGHWTGLGAGLEREDFIKLWAPRGQLVNDLFANLHSARAAGLDSLDRAGVIFKSPVAASGKAVFRTGAQYNIYEMDVATLRGLMEGSELFDQANPREFKRQLNALKGALESSKMVGWEFTGLRSIGDKLSSESWPRMFYKYMSIHPVSRDIEDASDLARFKNAASMLKRGVLGIGSHRDEVDQMRLWRTLGFASIGAGLTTIGMAGADETENLMGPIPGLGRNVDPFGNWLDLALALGSGAGGGAVTGFAGPGAFGRTTLRTAAALGAGGLAGAMGASNKEALGVSAIAAFPAFSALRHGLGKTASWMSGRAWGEYSKLYGPYEQVRNQIRFALSPIFEIQRYTEGMVLGGSTVVKDSNGINRQVAFNLRPMKRILKKFQVDENEVLQRFSTAARGQDWHDGLTMFDARLAEVGIFGYSPQKWMAATHFQLVNEYGMDPIEAVGTVKEIYQFGEKARSGLEQSVNFVFFPFSFQKQYLSKIAKFATDPETGDLARMVMIHDSIRAYQHLEEQTGFNRWRERHLPVLKQLRKVNALAYGISPGQFGGINRPFIDTMRAIPGIGDAFDMSLNAFLPQGLEIESKQGSEELFRIVKQAIPVWRDAEDFLIDTSDQLNVAFSDHHLAKAEARAKGYEEHQELRDRRDAFLAASGLSFADLYNNPMNPTVSSIGRWFATREREIREKYPEFQQAQAESVGYSMTRAQDKNDILRAPKTVTQQDIIELNRTGATRNGELALILFENDLDNVLGALGIPETDIPSLPGSIQEMIRERAMRLMVDAPDFIDHYRRFYSRLLGPIEMDVT